MIVGMFWTRVEEPARTRGGMDPAALALAAMAIVSLLPFAAASIPSMTDWAGHVGRYHVMLHASDPGLARFYVFRWQLVGNLGVDLVVRAIGGWLGAERTAWLITALIPPLTFAGLAAVSRALHGRVQAPAVLAGCFVLGNPFLFGFVNYCLAIALALWAFAGWVALARRPLAWRLLAMTPAVLVVWLAHAMGWAVLALLVAGFEGEALARRRTLPALARAGAMTLAFAPPVVLTLAWSHGGAGAMSGYGGSLLVRKAMAWLVVLRGGEPVVDIAATLLIAGAAAWLVAVRRVAVDWRLGGGAILLAVMVVAVPSTIFGSWGADERMAPVAAVAALAAMRWRGTARAATALAVAATLLFTARTAVIAADWHALDRRYQASLHALDTVPPGARIGVLVLASACHAGWRQTAWPHLAALAIPRRGALVNVEWPVAGAPMLRVTYPWPEAWRYDPSQMVDAYDCAGRLKPAVVQERIAALRPAGLDYLWLLDTRGLQGVWPGQRPSYSGADGALYRVR